MAITTTIVRSLQVNGVLVSAFCRQSIEFTATGLTSGDYAILRWGSYAFRCTQTVSGVGTGTFVIDVNFLSSIIGLPPTAITASLLTVTASFAIRWYSASDVYYSTDTVSVDANTKLCFGYPKKGYGAIGMNEVLNTGYYDLYLYHNGRYCTYDSTSGLYIITTTTTSTAYEIYIAPDSSHKEIAWIDRDGRFSFWNFRYLSQTNDNKSSNEVPYYALTNALEIMSSQDITRENSLLLNFDTVAYNADHYRMLCDISASPRVFYDGNIYRVKSCNNETAACNQNYHFKLTLQREENAVSY